MEPSSLKTESRIIGSLVFAAALMLGYMAWLEVAHAGRHVPHHRPTQGCPVVHAIQAEMNRADYEKNHDLHEALERIMRTAK
jgi:N-formylglutamate amidohydrolase